jgi:hypothetical protein
MPENRRGQITGVFRHRFKIPDAKKFYFGIYRTEMPDIQGANPR